LFLVSRILAQLLINRLFNRLQVYVRLSLPRLLGQRWLAVISYIDVFCCLQDILSHDRVLSFGSQDCHTIVQVRNRDVQGLSGLVLALVDQLLTEIFIVANVALFVEGRGVILFLVRLA